MRELPGASSFTNAIYNAVMDRAVANNPERDIVGLTGDIIAMAFSVIETCGHVLEQEQRARVQYAVIEKLKELAENDSRG